MVMPMNESHNMHTPDTPIDPSLVDEMLSTLVDGELSAADLERLFASHKALGASWSSYHLIGEVLRGSSAGLAPARADRVAGVMARVAQEPRPVLTSATPVVAQAGLPAANDALFRWKLVAGLASLATVGVLAWQMVAQTTPAAGPQLAVAPLGAPAPVGPAATEVVVPGELGPVIRDARLEELMAAHRQLGGASALQMPAGFLRNATFETPPR